MILVINASRLIDNKYGEKTVLHSFLKRNQPFTDVPYLSEKKKSIHHNLYYQDPLSYFGHIESVTLPSSLCFV